MHALREPHLTLIKRILLYVKGSLFFGLHIGVGPTQSLTAYSDADWAECSDSRRPSPLITKPRCHGLVSRSSTRLFLMQSEWCWVWRLLGELHVSLSLATVVYCDNLSPVYMRANLVHHWRTKHIEIDIHFTARRWLWERFGYFMSRPLISLRTSWRRVFWFNSSLILDPVFVFVILSLWLRVGIRDIIDILVVYSFPCIADRLTL
jgi:hypothetical protein